MAKYTRVVEEELMPKVRANLKNPANRLMINELFKKIYNKNFETLTDIAPMKIILFSAEYKETVHLITGITVKDAKAAIDKSDDIRSDVQVVNPFTVTLACMIRGVYELKDEKLLNSAMMIFTLFYYPSIYSKYFRFDPNPAIMRYVIENMSNKFKLRQLGSLIAALVDMSQTCMETNIKKLVSGKDSDMVLYINDLKSRLNSFFKNITREFREAHANQNFIQIDQDDMSEDSYHETDGSSTIVLRVANKVATKITTVDPNYALVDFAAKTGGVSPMEFRNFMNEFFRCEKVKKINDVTSLIGSLTNQYLLEGGKEENIKGTSFFIKGMKILRKTGNDTDVKIVNDALNTIVSDYTTIGVKVTRQASINNYKKAIFAYVVLATQKYV